MSSIATLLGNVRITRVPVKFTGTRAELFWRLVRGYLLMIPTLGLYRFWVTTMKRQFYWHNTSIDGDALEYSGTPLQLLIGFLFALAIFLPLYFVFFYLSTQVGPVVLVGYAVVAALFWFLFGYASYRGRDFRLSRTLWRGIRFDQQGNAWAYATRQFLWSMLVLATLGLAYPFMSADLWRYRYTNTWYGDRQFGFTGTWRTIAGPFYRAYATFAVLVGALLGVGLLTGGAAMAAAPFLAVVLGFGGFFYYRARESSRMFSEVQLGTARLRVEIKARALAAQFAAYSGMLTVAFIIIGLVGYLVTLLVQGQFDFTSLAGIARAGWIGVGLALGGYLASLAALSLMAEVYLDCGYWMLVARGATIVGIESLSTVRAGSEDKSLAGEGLADALNVGSF
ncbi:MAG TPA: DUF898 family protein [Devosia sp.]|uniref:DUF898 family protein n=1 Tax=Devosia sp. TaxID=1871048 RepID=UPI002DDD00AF|nr:DUF898 family protein [Devosia sp.]HEV2517567.1 DUF898 family protein [Devosia sp.]